MEENIKKVKTKFLIFELVDRKYGVKLSSVKRIKVLEGMIHLPYLLGFVEGMVIIEEAAIPAVNLRKNLKLSANNKNIQPQIITAVINNKEFGLMVDLVSEVLEVSEDFIQHISNAAGDIPNNYLEGIIEIEQQSIYILNINNIFESVTCQEPTF